MFEEAWSGEAKGVAHAEEFQRTAFYAILTLGLPDQPTWDARSRSIVRDFQALGQLSGTKVRFASAS